MRSVDLRAVNNQHSPSGASVGERAAGRLSEYGITAGELGAAASQTLMVTVLPLLLARYRSSALWIGFAIGGEGIVALFVPFWVGALSDNLPQALAERFGRRTFFLLLAAPLMAAALVLAPFLAGYWMLAAVALVFFVALHAYLTPLWALMIDAVPDARRGRVQGVRGVLRALGLAFGLVASGLLFALWEPLPFLIAAALVLVTTWLTYRAARRATRESSTPPRSVSQLRHVWRTLRRNPAAFRFLLANAFWSGGVDGIRPYVYIFATIVVGVSVSQTSLLLGLLVVGLAVGSLVIGWLGDTWDRGLILSAGLGILTVAMLLGFFARDVPSAVGILFAGGVGAAAIVALAYPLFTNLAGEANAGQYTGLFVMSVSFGRIVAPVLVGGAIDLGARLGVGDRGYPAMWPATGALAAVGWVMLLLARRAARAEPQSAEAEPAERAAEPA